MLLTDGFDSELLAALRSAVKAERATLFVIAPRVGGVISSEGGLVAADGALSASPSIFYDAVVILAAKAGAQRLAREACAVDWAAQAFAHLKAIGHTAHAKPLLERAGVNADAGVILLADRKWIALFIKSAKNGRIWDREPALRSPG